MRRGPRFVERYGTIVHSPMLESKAESRRVGTDPDQLFDKGLEVVVTLEFARHLNPHNREKAKHTLIIMQQINLLCNTLGRDGRL